jgi:tetratricopeptide (TPR) repeat protein
VSKVAKKRMTRKELKQPDKVLSTMERGVEFLNTYRRPLIIGAVVIVVAAALFVFYRVRTRGQAEEASTLYQKGVRTYTAAIDPSLRGDAAGEAGEADQAFATRQARAKAALKVFDSIVEQYEGYAVARAAHFYRGRCFYDLEQYAKAIGAFKKVLKSDPGGGCNCSGVDDTGSDALEALALENLGYAQAAKGRIDDARATFAKLRELDQGTRQDWAYYHLALMAEAKGRIKSAIRNYEKVRQTGRSSKDQDPSLTFTRSPLNELSKKRSRYLKMRLEGGDAGARPAPRRRAVTPPPGEVRPPAMGPADPEAGTSPADAMRPAAMDPARPAAMDPARPGAMQAMGPAAMEPARPAAMEPARPAAMEPARPAAMEPARPAAMEPARPAAMPADRPATMAP